MLKTLDRYIIRKYLSSFFFISLVFSLIAIVIDFSEKVDDYLEDDIPAEAFLFDYYLNYIPYINSLLWPLYALIAVIFFTSRMAYNSEIISIFNSGVSFYRMMVPYLVSATIIAGMHFFGNHYIIPESNKGRIEFENTYIWKNNFENKTKDIHLFLNESEKIYIRRYSVRDSLGYDVTLEQFKDGALVSKLIGNRMEWNTEQQKWRIKNYRIRVMDGLEEEIIQGKSIDTTLAIFPADLERRDNLKEAMTTPELLSFIDNEKKRGTGSHQKFEVERYRRTAEPFTIFILTLIGMAVASRKVRGGMGLHLALGAGLGGSYIFLSKFSMTFSTNAGLPPQIGVWVPNFIFIIITIYLLIKAQK